MATHSIFGSSAPPGTQIVSDDGQPIWVGNTFYTYGSTVTDWRCAGGRLYVAAANVASMPATVDVALWMNVTGTTNNLDTTPVATKTVTIPSGGGWVEWAWDTPQTITAGQLVMIGYTTGNKYLYTPSPTDSFIAASDGVALVMTDAVNAGPGLYRTFFRYGTGAVTHLDGGDASLWGVDILVDEGTSDVVPASGSAAGTFTLTGAATGTAPSVAGSGGSASGSLHFTGSATGASALEGSASGTFSWHGSATGPSSGRSIADENELTGASSDEWMITGAGDYDNVGFPRSFSTNVGETVEFSCTTDGGGVVLDIYRIGWYGGDGWHKVTSLTNTATAQPAPTTIPNSNGGVTCSNWSVTASWDIPSDATTGLYVGVYRNAAGNDASYIPFVVRDDSRQADIIIKTSDTTWALAYNYYGSPSSPLTGKSLYGSGGPLGDITTRANAVSYHRPVITRGGVTQTYWLACEAPMIRWAERMGYNVKYVASKDLDEDPSRIAGAKILISSGHDEYWSTNMREAVEAFRDAGGHVLFQSGNEVFWRTRFDTTDGNIMWCFKDTQDGPGSHVGGEPSDLVTWTGSWSDTRWAGRKPTNTLNGQYFRMNGINDKTATFDHTADYASHPFWRNSSLAGGTNFSVAGLIGFEADEYDPTVSGAVRLSQTTFNIDNNRADDNGETYTNDGNLDWGLCSQRHPSGAVVIGFGTCQWSWGLDSTHDRGSDVANLNIQQAEYNVLRDLGAAPATPHTGIVTSSPASLVNYGTVVLSGSAGGTFAFTGSASGDAPVVPAHEGAAAGVLSFSGLATGEAPEIPQSLGAASGLFSFTGSATGNAPVVGQKSGVALGTFSWSGHSSGSRESSGSGSGTLSWTGVATGDAPNVNEKRGAASGQLSWAGAATGSTEKLGQSVGSISWTGIAEGLGDYAGQALGALNWIGRAVGQNAAHARTVKTPRVLVNRNTSRLLVEPD